MPITITDRKRSRSSISTHLFSCLICGRNSFPSLWLITHQPCTDTPANTHVVHVALIPKQWNPIGSESVSKWRANNKPNQRCRHAIQCNAIWGGTYILIPQLPRTIYLAAHCHCHWTASIKTCAICANRLLAFSIFYSARRVNVFVKLVRYGNLSLDACLSRAQPPPVAVPPLVTTHHPLIHL